MLRRRPFLLDRQSSRSWIALVALTIFVAVMAACSGGDDDSGSSESALAERGRWKLPTEVLDAGRNVRVSYDAAPRWTGFSACAGRLKTGGVKLGDFLLNRFAVVTSVGGYACRRNTADRSKMSVHGTGRALDVFIPRAAGSADNTHGDKVANWLVLNAQRIGVQLVIWDRTIWRSNGTNDSIYGGPHAHDDHLHVELTNEAAAATTAWFLDPNGGTATDGGSADSSAEATTMEPKTDAGTADARADSAVTPAPDSGTPADAGTRDATPGTPADDDHSDEDAGPDAEAPAPKAEEPPSMENGRPSDGLESAGDEPGEPDSLGEAATRRQAPSLEDEEPSAADGCSASPRSPLSNHSGLGALGLAFGLAAALRRRKRS